jgi:hypothetical protein
MKRSGDRESELTAETRRRGENQTSTTETQRHGEERRWSDFSDHTITCDHPITRSLHLCHPERVGANATASRRTPATPIPECAASGRSYETPEDFIRGFRNAIRTFRATLREVFDESAYDRFLLRTHASRSIASYREFTRERDAAMAKKPRCC